MSNFTISAGQAECLRLSGLSVGAALVLMSVFVVVGYVLGVLFWSWLLMLGTGDAGLGWSYLWTATHWGLLVPVVLAVLFGSRR